MLVTAPDGTTLVTSRIGGPGAPVLVVPGGPCRDVEYVGDLAGLAEVRPLVVLHPRGTSTTGGLSRGWWRDAEDAVAVADALGLDRVDVVAHSAGTRLALALATRFPERVSSLALVTPPATWLSGVASDAPAIVARRADPALEAAFAAVEEDTTDDEASFQVALARQARAGYAAWTDVEREHSRMGAMRLASVLAWFRDVPPDASAQVTAAATRLEWPRTLVVAGLEDVLTGVAPVEAYARLLGAREAWLDACGHYPWVEVPAAFRAALDGWLCG